MIKKFFIYTIIITIPYVTFSQEELTKDEIYTIWVYFEENRDKINDNFDSIVVDFVDSLKIQKIDTVGIYLIRTHGSNAISYKKKCNSSWTIYIHWIQNGRIFHQKFKRNCIYNPVLIKESNLISYYIHEKHDIDNQKIMPVIISAYNSDEGKFKYKSWSTTSYTHYTIYCEIKGNSTLESFDSYEIENKNGVFYSDNNESKIIRWWKMIENQIKEIEKE